MRSDRPAKIESRNGASRVAALLGGLLLGAALALPARAEPPAVGNFRSIDSAPAAQAPSNPPPTEDDDTPVSVRTFEKPPPGFTGRIGPLQPLRNEDGTIPKTEAGDSLAHKIAYYGALLLLVAGAVLIVYRYLAFAWAFEETPELALGHAGGEAEAARPVAAAAAAVGTQPSDPRKRRAPPPDEHPAEPPRRESPPARRAPTADQLLASAAKVFDGSDLWMTAGQVADAIRADEASIGPLLERLVDEGRLQEARAGDGQTVYRAAR